MRVNVNIQKKIQKHALLLFVIAEDYGLFTHRIDLARRAKKEGYRVGIATRISQYGDAIQKEGFELYPLKELKRGGFSLFQDIKATRELYILYKRLKPTIVHQVAMKPVLYGTIAAYFAKIPYIVNALGGLGYLFISESLKAYSIRLILKNLFKALFFKKNVALILQNQDDIDTLKGVINPSRIYLIRGSGVDVKRFTPGIQKRTRKKETVTVLMLSRLLWDKGVGELYEAARILRTKDIPVEIIVAGDVDLENPASVTSEILEVWKKEGFIKFIGEAADIMPLLKEADIGILPSYREGLPKALLEQGAMGLPLITTDVPGCREVVIDDFNGVLVPVKNAEALVNAIEKMVLDVSLRQVMGKASRQLIEKNFSVDKINQAILDVYKNIQK